MIVIGADTHKRTHTCAAASAATGRSAGDLTAAAREPGFRELLAWGRDLGEERIWAIEDCRHVSGALERFLVAAGERVVRVPPKLTGQGRRGERTPGKSDPIDALAVARAALREGPDTLPAAHLEEDALRVKLLLGHREDLHDLWPDLELPAGCLDRTVWLDRLARRLARTEQGTRVTIARELVVEIRRRTRRVAGLGREIGALVETQAPDLLELEGCGPLTAARLIAETGGAGRLSSDAKFARLAGVAPIPASSGNRTRHRLDRGGNRRLNCALHRIAVTQGRCHTPAREFLARKQAEGKTRREALRCLKRHLARRVWRLLVESERGRSITPSTLRETCPGPQITAMA
jgi:transposase